MMARQGREKPRRKRNILGDLEKQQLSTAPQITKTHLPLSSRLIVQVNVSLSSPKVPHTDKRGGTCNLVKISSEFHITIQPKEKTQTARSTTAMSGLVKHLVYKEKWAMSRYRVTAIAA